MEAFAGFGAGGNFGGQLLYLRRNPVPAGRQALIRQQAIRRVFEQFGRITLGLDSLQLPVVAVEHRLFLIQLRPQVLLLPNSRRLPVYLQYSEMFALLVAVGNKGVADQGRDSCCRNCRPLR